MGNGLVLRPRVAQAPVAPTHETTPRTWHTALSCVWRVRPAPPRSCPLSLLGHGKCQLTAEAVQDRGSLYAQAGRHKEAPLVSL